jgi:NAD(P)-dependent dehydrogenase (short-subunit alcohol dehydrogenase family)
MEKLAGKVAVVTGATSGLALASAKSFVAEGAYVFITGRNQDSLDKAVQEIGKNVTGVRADSSNPADLDRLFAIVKDQKGHIDILYASAGQGGMRAPLGTISDENYEAVFGLNVKGTLFTVQKALPLINNGGSIILTGSIAASKGLPGMTVYNASTAAVRSFARTWANELTDRKIRVNVISPGPIETGAFAKVPDDVKNKFSAMVPMGRFGKPEEIAGVALFFASADSSFITGVELNVDGGLAQV